MIGAELITVLDEVTTTLEGNAEEFRRLDAAVGDGDLGVTVRMACVAVREALAELDDDAGVADVMRAAAMAIADANPSTMAALTAGGLLKAAKAVGQDPVDLDGGGVVGRTFFDAVAARGKSEVGDKTILDAIAPSLDALEAAIDEGRATEQAIDDAVAAADGGAEGTTDMAGRKGRARWVAEGGQGNPDPGAVLYVRFLQAWQQATSTNE